MVVQCGIVKMRGVRLELPGYPSVALSTHFTARLAQPALGSSYVRHDIERPGMLTSSLAEAHVVRQICTTPFKPGGPSKKFQKEHWIENGHTPPRVSS